MTMAQTRKAISSYLPTALQKVLHRLFPFILILVIVVVGIPPFIKALIRDPSVLKSLRRTRETFFGSAFPVIAPVFDWYAFGSSGMRNGADHRHAGFIARTRSQS